MRALALISSWKFRNSLRTLFSDPRKLIGLLLLVAWIGMSLFVATISVKNGGDKQSPFGAIDPAMIRVGLGLLLIVIVFGTIDTALGDYSVAFALPDIDYIFPSPIPRQSVLALWIPKHLFRTFMSSGLLLGMIWYLTKLAGPTAVAASGLKLAGFNVFSLAFTISIYKNLGFAVALRVAQRKNIRFGLGLVLGLITAAAGTTAYRGGLPALGQFLDSSWIRIVFLPSFLAKQMLLGSASTQPLAWLAVFSLISFVPVFAGNVNFYEQSIVSTERLASLRIAAKGGMASMLAAKASQDKRKQSRSRSYTVRPFGQGAGALFWAHLCASSKRPILSFAGPIVVGLILGALSAVANAATSGIGFIPLTLGAIYSSFIFLATGKVAAESSVRRRELLSPLPVPSSQAVLANLGVPFLSMALFCLTTAIGYAAFGGKDAGPVLLGAGLVFPTRLAARMVLQYIIVFGYPDAADKIQQLMAQVIYYLAALPFLIAEVIVCLPGILLNSPLTILLSNFVYQAVILVLLVLIAGRAADRAVASGEPVRIWGLAKR
jgi:hypothetical protein